MRLREILWPSKVRLLEPGFFHSRVDLGDRQFRLHLRVEKDGKGTLVINASKILHLNETATELARYLLEGYTADQAASRMQQRYRVGPQKARKDFLDLRDKIYTLASTDDVCPISFLDIKRIEPFSAEPSSPMRMDIALTYRCDNNCGHCYVPDRKVTPELKVEQWKEAISRCWKAGIPHICFTGGEPLLYDGLLELVQHSEETGIVTGILTDGRRLSDTALTEKLVAAGIDHFQITLESCRPETHDRMVGRGGAWNETVTGIKNAVKTPVFTMTNTTLTKLNASHIADTFRFIAGLGVKTVACNGMIYSGRGEKNENAIAEEDLKPHLLDAVQAAAESGLRFIWYTPTRYCNLDPVELGLGIKHCTAARLNMCIEPDGTVIPCQSYYISCGNILTDEFETIWQSKPCREMRERKELEDKCKTCDKLSFCGGGCPLYQQQKLIYCPDSHSVT